MLTAMQSLDNPLAQLRRTHEAQVLGLLRRQGALSRAELGSRSGLSRTTLYDIVSGLLASGTVVAAGPQGPRRRGRPVELISLNPAAGYALGIDFARRTVHVAMVNAAHEVIGTAGQEHPAGLGPDGRVALARGLVTALGAGRAHLGSLGAIGVGVVGPVPNAGTELSRRLSQALYEAFAAPVMLDNNTRLAALAEATWGAAAGCADALYLRLSYGVGGGLVVGGALHRGADGLSGEIGHIVVDPGGHRCECGGRGCLETVSSVGAVLSAVRAAGGHADSLPGLVRAAAAGDRAVLDVLGVVGERVGRVLAALCNAMGPSALVVGGELTEVGPPLFGPMEAALREGFAPFARSRVELRRAVLGDYGGALGGIALVLHESPLLAGYPTTVQDKPTDEASDSEADDLMDGGTRERR